METPTLFAAFGCGMWGTAFFANVRKSTFVGVFATPGSVEILAWHAGFFAAGGRQRRAGVGRAAFREGGVALRKGRRDVQKPKVTVDFIPGFRWIHFH